MLCHMSSSIAADALRDARTGAGLSRRTLAAKAGVPTSTVSRIENDQVDPTVGMLQRLLAAAGERLILVTESKNQGPTLASLATAVEEVGGRQRIDWVRLRGFADWAAQQRPDRLAAAMADPPARTGTPLDAILAAFAEQLAVERRVERPTWARTVEALDEEWSPPATPRMRAEAAAATPEPFRRRNIVLDKRALFHFVRDIASDASSR